MNKSLDVLAKELKNEIQKVHKMTIDLPEELFIKSQMVQSIKKKYIDKYEEFKADCEDQKDPHQVFLDKFDYLTKQDWSQR